MNDEFLKLIEEEKSSREDCELCKESTLKVGDKTKYGAVIVLKIGKSSEDGWFATISPKTGGDPERDFTMMLMPLAHMTHFSQIDGHPALARNYGLAFAKLTSAMSRIMAEEEKDFNAASESREASVSVATYGKTTTWRPKKEHLHIKIFPFRGDIGQPYTVDSSYGRKKIELDPETKEEFVRMKPVKKVNIAEERFKGLSARLIGLLK